MSVNDKIDMNIFQVVTKAIAESDNLSIMADHLTHLLVGALEIMACTIFALNLDAEELEVLATCGLSLDYTNKGPVLADKSIGSAVKGEPVLVKDVRDSDLLQYPEEARKEGIGSIVSLPILFCGESIGELRLYHHEVWDISDGDVKSLLILGENIGLAMMYTRMVNALQSIQEIMTALPSDLVPLFRK
jgi:signal transduction protein with GAF and PtsI domain